MTSPQGQLSSAAQPGPLEAETLHAEDLVPNLPESENKRFYPALDGLRAVAVLMVFCTHYLNQVQAINWGWTGVDLFFVLSGFLITGILYDTRNSGNRFRNFYIRRILRIFPLYYGVLLVAFLLTPVFHWMWRPASYFWLLYLSNYTRFVWLPDYLRDPAITEHLRSTLFHSSLVIYLGHFWSLAVEEQFYLAWPLVVFLVKDRIKLRNICVGVWIFCLAARVACLYVVPQAYLNAEFVSRLAPLRADSLLLGGFLALALRGPEARWLSRAVRPALLLFVAGFAVFEAIYHLRSHHFYYPNLTGSFLSTTGYSLIDLFAGIVILLALEPSSFLYRLFTLKPLRRLGQMSYGFYVFHEIPHEIYSRIAFYVYGSRPHPEWILALIALSGTLMLSYLSFRFFETPFLRLKDRFTA
jgi:peptidoglycan/LPS O-acetylase OafA/YrhL